MQDGYESESGESSASGWSGESNESDRSHGSYGSDGPVVGTIEISYRSRITCTICGQSVIILHQQPKKPEVCDHVRCQVMMKDIYHYKLQSWTLRLINRDQSNSMQKFPSPPLQLGNNDCVVCDAKTETEDALRNFILYIAHNSTSSSAGLTV